MSDYFDFWDSKLVPGRWSLEDPYIDSRWINPERFTCAGGPQTVNGQIVVKLYVPVRALVCHGYSLAICA